MKKLDDLPVQSPHMQSLLTEMIYSRKAEYLGKQVVSADCLSGLTHNGWKFHSSTWDLNGQQAQLW